MTRFRENPLGQAVPRREDARLLRGEGRYLADIPGNWAEVGFLRSPVASGRLRLGSLDAARAIPGVLAVFGAADVCSAGGLSVNEVLAPQHVPEWPILAGETVSAVGQPLVAVVAETLAAAQDAAEAIEMEITEACWPEAGRITAQGVWSAGDWDAVRTAAARVVSAEIAHPGLAACSLETRGVAAVPGDDGGLEVWLSSQTPHRARAELARLLSLDPARLRVVAPEVGGAFGAKASLYPEEVVTVWAALSLGRPVRWTASRAEDFLSASHGRGARSRGELALDAAGRILGLRARFDVPLGHWLPNSALVPAWNAGRMAAGCYDIPVVDIVSTARLAARPPVGIYRGAGRPEAILLIERLVDEAARAAGRDPLDFRIAHVVAADTMPRRTATGTVLDGGDYAANLRTLRDEGGYGPALDERAALRAAGGLAGVGVAAYVEPCGTGWESARVTLHADDTASVAFGGSAQGQGRETALAQIAAGRLGLDMDAVRILHGDTATCPEGIGALASRSTPIGGSAVVAACDAAIARRQRGEGGDIVEEAVYTAPAEAWGSGAAFASVTVDPETGVVRLSRFVMVDDAGLVINPRLVEGQLLGGIAQGLGEALLERLVFDEDGQLLTGSLMDYALPRADDMPPVTLLKRSSPTAANLLGARGVGEAGTIAAPAAILNAVSDALAPLGVDGLALPLSPENVWRAMALARKG